MTATRSAAAQKLHDCMATLPLIAILRGVQSDEIEDIADALVGAGFTLIEVPLNSPDPLASIARLRRYLHARNKSHVIVGAGTVMSVTDVHAVKDAGGEIIVMPHCDLQVVHAAIDADMVVLPGVATPTEAFAALAAGAHGLKLFPAELLGTAAISAWRAVLPAGTAMLPVGGVTPDNIARYAAAGAASAGALTQPTTPPLTCNNWPLTKPPLSEHKNATMAPISSCLPRRATGICCSKAW
jgi:2-dehydro-3-deoxyphosphogalactonate aldolase